MPSIDVYIHIPTSPPLLDLTSKTPLTITIDFVLNHTNPITLYRRTLDHFRDLVTYDGGLNFTDTSTGETVAVNYVYEVTDTPFPTFSRRTQKAFVTLFPGKRYRVTTAFKPFQAKPIYMGNEGRCISQEESDRIYARLKPVKQWKGVREFEDGKTYEIGLRRLTTNDKWLDGSIADLLSWWSYIRSFFVTRKVERLDRLPLRIVKPAQFSVKRPQDPAENEMIDWPVLIRNLDWE